MSKSTENLSSETAAAESTPRSSAPKIDYEEPAQPQVQPQSPIEVQMDMMVRLNAMSLVEKLQAQAEQQKSDPLREGRLLKHAELLMDRLIAPPLPGGN